MIYLFFPGTFRSTSSTYRPSSIGFVTADWWSDLTNVPLEYQKWNSLATTSLCPQASEVNAVAGFPHPANIKQLQEFCGYDQLMSSFHPRLHPSQSTYVCSPDKETHKKETHCSHPFIPMVLCRCVFEMLHSLAHPFGHSAAKLMKQKFIWHDISDDARHQVRACIPCQTSNVTSHTESWFGQFHQPSCWFDLIHVDIIGPLPPSEGASYLFTIIKDQQDGSRQFPWQRHQQHPMQKLSLDRSTPFTLQFWSSFS